MIAQNVFLNDNDTDFCQKSSMLVVIPNTVYIIQ